MKKIRIMSWTLLFLYKIFLMYNFCQIFSNYINPFRVKTNFGLSLYADRQGQGLFIRELITITYQPELSS